MPVCLHGHQKAPSRLLYHESANALRIREKYQSEKAIANELVSFVHRQTQT